MVTDVLLKITEALNYNKLQRLRENIEKYDEDILLKIIHGATKNTNTILFFPGSFLEISIFGTTFHYFYPRGVNPDNYIIAFPTLDEKYLRKLFTGLELLVFKLCQLTIECQNIKYHFEKEKTRQRVRRLKDILNIDDWGKYINTFDNIMFVRDSFAHSFISIEKILYKNIPLKSCFGYTSSGTMGTHDFSFDGKFFFDDVKYFFDPIAAAFTKCQLDQLDRAKLFQFCDHILKERSLAL